MSGTNTHFHGSDLELIEKVYGIKKEEIISFSANVNPLGISPLMRRTLTDNIDAVTSYPDREYTDIRRSISSYAGCDMGHVVVGNGSTELISLFIRLIHPECAMIIAPTYFEYERELSLSGCSHIYYNLREDEDFTLDVSDCTKALDECGADMLIMCNPNNPTSGLVNCDAMRHLLSHCKQKGIYLLVDETYVEFACEDTAASVPLVYDFDNLIILRGTSKFFACPGLRLGYGISSNASLLSRLKVLQDPWSLNVLAAVAGTVMFKDHDYIENTRDLIDSERKRIYKILNDMGTIKVYPPHANFIMFKLSDDAASAKELFETAIHEKLMIRDCSDFEALNGAFIRFCFMSPSDNDRLLSVISEFVSK